MIRYAQSGQYIGIGLVERNGFMYLFINDRGKGMEHETKGAGIGLSIVSLMTKEMNIDWVVTSSPNGIHHYLSQNLNEI